MEKLCFDTGIKEYEVNGNGVLRFNPGDPNLYARFFDAVEQVQIIEEELVEKGKALAEGEDSGETLIRLMKEMDRKVKDVLGNVFGLGNDFDQMLGGVNLLAVAGNGERVVTNLIHALLPVIEEGARSCANQKVDEAVTQAKANRAQRRAQK